MLGRIVSGKGWQQKRGTVSKRIVISAVERGEWAKSIKIEDLTIKPIKKSCAIPLFKNATVYQPSI